MKEFENFYEGENGNNQSDLNILNITAHTFPKDYAKIFWQAALEWVRDYMIKQELDALYFDYVLLDKIEKELEDESVYNQD